MANFYTVADGKVNNILVAETLSDAEKATGDICYEYTTNNTPAIGWDFDGTTFVVPIPVIVPIPDYPAPPKK